MEYTIVKQEDKRINEIRTYSMTVIMNDKELKVRQPIIKGNVDAAKQACIEQIEKAGG